MLTSAAIIQAIDYAVSNGARVINASFTRGGPCSHAEYAALSEANNAGVMVLQQRAMPIRTTIIRISYSFPPAIVF